MSYGCVRKTGGVYVKNTDILRLFYGDMTFRISVCGIRSVLFDPGYTAFRSMSQKWPRPGRQRLMRKTSNVENVGVGVDVVGWAYECMCLDSLHTHTLRKCIFITTQRNASYLRNDKYIESNKKGYHIENKSEDAQKTFHSSRWQGTCRWCANHPTVCQTGIRYRGYRDHRDHQKRSSLCHWISQ